MTGVNIDNGAGLILSAEKCPFEGQWIFEVHEPSTGRRASLLFAYHEEALHDDNGHDTDLHKLQKVKVDEWFENIDQYEAMAERADG